MQKREPPYKNRPTETLFLPGKTKNTNTLKTKHSITPIPIPITTKQQQRIKRQLDEETRRKILDYVINRKGCEKKLAPELNKSMGKMTDRRQDFYVPSRKSEPVGESPLDGVKLFFETTLKISTNTAQSNVIIDIEFLRENGITLAVLIDEIGIKISDMYAGDVLRSFSDLLEIGFQPIDLVRDRKLFNCDMLGNLYNTDYNHIRKRGVVFDLRDIVTGGFWASDLKALEYNLEEAIETGEIILKNLKTLNFSLSGLILLGFKKEHLKKLKIGKREALDLGWAPDEYQQFLL